MGYFFVHVFVPCVRSQTAACTSAQGRVTGDECGAGARGYYTACNTAQYSAAACALLDAPPTVWCADPNFMHVLGRAQLGALLVAVS